MLRAIVRKLAGAVHALTPARWLPERAGAIRVLDLVHAANDALAVYGDNPREGSELIDLPSVSGRVLFRRIGSNVWIAVRGTANARNVILDLSARRVEDSATRLRYHEGFLAYTRAAWTEINPRLRSGDIVRVTGHSLGGAVAQMLVSKLALWGASVESCITFGAPMIGDRKAALGSAKRTHVIRVVNDNDLIPCLPFSPFYWHCGDVYAIDAEGQPRMLGARAAFRLGFSSWFGAVAKGLRRIGEEYNDHRMIEYKSALVQLSETSAL